MLLYLSDDVVSAPLPPHLAPGVGRCSAIALYLRGAFAFSLGDRPPSNFVANNETLQQKPSLCTSADLFFSCCGSVAALPALANCNEHVAKERFHARTHPHHTLHGGDGAEKLKGRTKLGDKGFEQVKFRHV
jgi:hypothetical protein